MNTVRVISLAVLLLSGFFHPLNAQTLAIEESEFWVYLNDGQGKETSYQSDVVPLVPGRACYGWRIRISGVEGLIKFKEVFELPAVPETWEQEDGEFSRDSKTICT